MAKFHTLPWKLELYFADTRHLNCLQHGAYLQLIALAWRTPGQAIDLSNDVKIAYTIRATKGQWLKMKPTILAFFEHGADGLYRQKRLTAIYHSVDSVIAKKVEAGRKSAAAREKMKADTRKKSPSAVQNLEAKSLKNKDTSSTPVLHTKTKYQNQTKEPPAPSGRPPNGEATPGSEGISNLVLGKKGRRFPALERITPRQEHYDLAIAAGKDPGFVDQAAARLVLWSQSHARARVTDWNAEFKKRLLEDLAKAPTQVRTRPRSGLGQVLDKLEGYNDQRHGDADSRLPPIANEPLALEPARPGAKRSHGGS